MVRPADLVFPVGRIETFLFPDDTADDLTARLQAYLTEAVALSSPSDLASKSWAYYRAFTAVALRLSATPQSRSVTDEVNWSYGAQQVQRIKDLADEALAEWTAFLAAVDEAPAGRLHGPVTNTFTW